MSVPFEQLPNRSISWKSPDKASRKQAGYNTPGLLWLPWLHGPQRKYIVSMGWWPRKSGYTGGDAHAGRKDSVNEKAGGSATLTSREQLATTCPVSMGRAQVQNRMILLAQVGGHRSYPRLLHSPRVKDPQSLQTQVQGRDGLGSSLGFTAYKSGALDGDP